MTARGKAPGYLLGTRIERFPHRYNAMLQELIQERCEGGYSFIVWSVFAFVHMKFQIAFEQ